MTILSLTAAERNGNAGPLEFRNWNKVTVGLAHLGPAYDVNLHYTEIEVF